MRKYTNQFLRYMDATRSGVAKFRIRLAAAVPPLTAAILLYGILCFAACTSLQTDMRYSGGAGAAREKTLETLEAAVVAQRIRYNADQLKRIQMDIEAFLREPSTDSSYLARLYALCRRRLIAAALE